VGRRAETLTEEMGGWDISIAAVHDTVSKEHGFVITRVVSVAARVDAQPDAADGSVPHSEPGRR
jgi:hypothetical protein